MRFKFILFLFFISNILMAAASREDSLSVKNLITLSDQLLAANPDSAKILLDSAVVLAKKSEQQHLLMKALNKRGSWYWRQNLIDSAGMQYQEINELAQKTGDTAYQVKSYNNLGLVYHQIASADSAEYFFKEAIRLAQLAGMKKDKAIAQNELAVLYMSQNRNIEAIDLLQESSAVLSESGDPFRITQQHIALGWLYQSSGDFENSIKNYRLAVKSNQKNPEVDFLPIIYNNMGMAFQNLSEHLDSAKYYYTRAINLSLDNPASDVTSPTINLGNIYYQEDNYPEALRYYRIVLSKKDIEKKFRPYSAILINMGLSYLELQKFDSAEFYLKKGLDIALHNTLYAYQQNAYYGLYQLDSARKNLPQALEYYKKQEEIEDSLKLEKLSDRIRRLEYEQDLMEREQENKNLSELNELNRKIISNQWILLVAAIIFLLFALAVIIILTRSRRRQDQLNALLEQRNSEIEQQKAELEKSNLTKDKLFAIIAHDLRNPFDALLGLLAELDENYAEYDDEFRKEIIRNLRESSNNAYKMLIDLLEWSRTQRGNINYTPLEFNVKEILDEVYNNYLPVAKAKSIELEMVENNSRVNTDPQFIRSILSNLVNNAIKFTAEGGKVVIKTKEEKNKLQIMVKDNGIGIPEEKINKLFEAGSDFQRFGTADEAGTGLGLVMCMEYIKLMGENIRVQSEEGTGSVFAFTVPLA